MGYLLILDDFHDFIVIIRFPGVTTSFVFRVQFALRPSSPLGDEARALQEAQRARQSMQDVLELQDVPEIDGEQSEEVEHMALVSQVSWCHNLRNPHLEHLQFIAKESLIISCHLYIYIYTHLLNFLQS